MRKGRYWPNTFMAAVIVKWSSDSVGAFSPSQCASLKHRAADHPKYLFLQSHSAFSKAAVWIVLALALFFLFKQFEKPEAQESVTYSQFMDEARAGNIKSVVIQGNHLTVTPAVGNPYQLTAPRTPWMVDDLMKYGVAVSAKPEEKPSPL